MIEKHDLRCDCGDERNHLIQFQFDDNENWNDTITVAAAMNHYIPWYRRINIAVKYLFGIDNTYCHYVEGMYDKRKALALYVWLAKIIPKMND